MKNTILGQRFYIKSEDEEAVEKLFIRHKGEDFGNVSNASDSLAKNQHHNNPTSYNTLWPQSCRFLGTPTPPSLGSLFLSSSLTRRHTLEFICSEKTYGNLIKYSLKHIVHVLSYL